MTRTLRILLLPLALMLAIAGVAAPAFAAPTWTYSASSGGTYVQLSNGLVTSDMTSKSGIVGSTVPASHKNSVATAKVSGLVSTGAVSTSNSATAVSGGTRVLTTAQTAGVDILNGLVRADAVTSTIDTLLKPDGSSTSTGATNFVNLKIAGVTLPVNIPQNYGVNVPGVASISLNYFATASDADGGRASMGWAIAVQLLKPQGNLPAGAVISINPEMQVNLPLDPTNKALFGGYAYGTRIKAAVSESADVESPATAFQATPLGGSDGATLTNTTAGIDLPAVLTVGAVKSTSTSDRFGTGDNDADVVNTNETASVNLLNGLVQVEALKVTAHSRRIGGTCTTDTSFHVAKLVVAGKEIPVDVSPNTVIDVAGIAKVTLNGTYTNGCVAAALGVKVVLTTEQAGLPVGAVAEIGWASTDIG